MRKTKLNNKIKDLIIEAIADGNTNDVAAKLAGISPATFYNWMAKGRAAEKGIYRNFVDEVETAEARAIADAVKEIKKASRDYWQASAWYLERKDPANWGRKERLSADINHSGAIKTEHEETVQVEFEKKIENDPKLQQLYIEIWQREKELESLTENDD